MTPPVTPPVTNMTLRAVLASVVAVVALPLIAVAQDAAAPARIDEACKTEMASLCVAKGDKQPRGIRCLTDNQAKLSAACATAIKATQERRTALQTACKADADKLCPTAKDKGGQFIACLRGKTAELSKPCADAIAALPQPAAKK